MAKYDHDSIVNQIADHWGGTDEVLRQHRGWNETMTRFRFLGDEGASRYDVTIPGASAPMYEDSGRPCGTTTVPADKYHVRCIDDAPDCHWYVGVDEDGMIVPNPR